MSLNFVKFYIKHVLEKKIKNRTRKQKFKSCRTTMDVLVKYPPEDIKTFADYEVYFTLTPEHIESRKDDKWGYRVLAANPNITWDYVLKNLDKPWDFRIMSCNPNITWEIIHEHPEIDWCFSYYSDNPNIKWEHVMQYPDENWDYSAIASQPNITLDILLNNKELREFMDGMSSNPNITFQDVLDHPELKWRNDMLSMNPNITPKIVLANLDYPWDHKYFACNPNFTLDDLIFVGKKIGKNCVDKYDYILSNPNATISELGRLYEKKKYKKAVTTYTCNLGCDHPHFRSPQYRRWVSKERHDQIYCELISRACRTSRIFSWNEGAAEEMPEAYAEECRRWRLL